jgi:hypothetical protein
MAVGGCGISSAANCVTGIDHPVRPERHPRRREDEHDAGDGGDAGEAGIEQVDPTQRVEPAAQSAVGHRRRGGGDVEERAEERHDPRRPDEADGEEVLDALRPGDGDQHERAEQHGDAQAGDQSSEPQRALAVSTLESSATSSLAPAPVAAVVPAASVVSGDRRRWSAWSRRGPCRSRR